MKKFIVCMMLFMVCALFVGAEEKDIFISKSHGFSMEVPLDNVPDEGSYPMAFFALSASGGFASNVNIVCQSYKGTIEEYDKLTTGQFNQQKLEIVSRKLKKSEAMYDYKGKMEGKSNHWYARAIKRGNYIYLITATTLESQWESRKKKIVDSVDSFKLNK